MATRSARPDRVLPDGTFLHNRLLAALPHRDFARILKHLRMSKVKTGETLQDHSSRITDVYFPNGGVFSVMSFEMAGGRIETIRSIVNPDKLDHLGPVETLRDVLDEARG